MNLLPAGPILERYGPTIVSTVGVIFTVLPHTALAILATYKSFVHEELVVYTLLLLGGKVKTEHQLRLYGKVYSMAMSVAPY